MTISTKPGHRFAGKRSFRSSLRFEIIFLMVLVSLVSSGLIGVVGYLQAWKVGHRSAISELATEAELYAELITVPFNDITNVARVLAQSPPVLDVLDYMNEPGAMLLAARATDLPWRIRLETLFKSFLADRPHYTQARLILLDDGGREAVRVNSRNGLQWPVPPDRLQRKGDEPYMRPLYDGTAPDGYFSEVNLNREEGRIEVNAIETIRFVKPVRDPQGRIRAAIVLNADYEKLLNRVHYKIRTARTITMRNAQGDYVEYAADSDAAILHFRESTDWEPAAAIREALTTAPEGGFVQRDGVTAYSVTRTIPKADGAETLRIIASAPNRVLYAGAFEVLNRSIAVSSAIAIAVIICSSLITAKITRPLKILAEKIRNRPDNDAKIDFQTGWQNEIGDLATAFRTMSNELLASSSLARAVFEYAADGILIVETNGNILNANSAAHSLFGQESLAGMCIESLIPPPQRAGHLKSMQRAEGAGNNLRMAPNQDVCGLRSDGSLVHLDISISTMSFSGRTVFVAILRDISVQREAERQKNQLVLSLRKAKEELERSNAELDSFAYVASHDLKAPLRVIDNASRWLEEDLGSHLDAEARESMKLMRNRVARMERLLDDLLQHSRIGREEHRREMVSGKELMQIVMDLVNLPQHFRIMVDPALERAILPRMPLQNVLLNLVSNAIKHNTRADGEVTVSFEESDQEFIFEVRDNGPGIPERFQKDVFKMFKTLKPRDMVEGSGMGLAIVQKTVTTNGGEIALASREGEGCCFRFTWPKTQFPSEIVA